MGVTDHIAEGTFVRAMIISKERNTLSEICGRIHYERYLGYAIKIVDSESSDICTLDLNLMTEYHIAPELEGRPLFINLRIDPDILVTIAPERNL